MVKRKPPKKINWFADKKKPLTFMGTLLVLFGLIWGLDNHWLPREIHNISMAQVEKTLQVMQKEIITQSAQNQEFYWSRKELELKGELRKRPNDQQLIRELQEVQEERRRCQDQVRGLQKK